MLFINILQRNPLNVMIHSRLLFLTSIIFLSLTACQPRPYNYNHEADQEIYHPAPAPSNLPSPKKPKSKSYARDNQNLAHAALSKIISTPELSNDSIQTASYFGKLLVVGQVNNQNDIKKISSSLSQVKGVKKISMSVKVSPKPTKYRRIANSRLNTKVKKTIARLNIPYSHLVILTDNNAVYILGTVNDFNKKSIELALLNIPGIYNVYFS